MRNVAPVSRAGHPRLRVRLSRLLIPAGFWITTVVVAVASARIIGSRFERIDSVYGPTSAVVVARVKIDIGHLLAPGDLAIKTLPDAVLSHDTTDRIDQLVGLRVTQSIDAGLPISRALTSATATSSLATRIGRGHRGVIIDLPGPALPVHAGDHVDVVIARDGDGLAESVVVDVVVLQRNDTSVLLRVPDGQVNALAGGLSRGRPMLALRGG
jgi:Flp pilus assembly protein CpaB